ncbi:hypothetical protein LPJ81_004349, partial [Coemansia sp. IMI 209127]
SDDTDYDESDEFIAPPSSRLPERGRGSGRRGRYPAGRRGGAAGGNGTSRRGPGRPPKLAVGRAAQTSSRPVGRPRKHPQPKPKPKHRLPPPPQPRAQSLDAVPVVEAATPATATSLSLVSTRKRAEPLFSTSLVANMSTGELISVVRRFLGDEDPDSDDVEMEEQPFALADLNQLLKAGDQLYFTTPEFQELIDLEVEALRAEQLAHKVISGAPEATNRLAHIPDTMDDQPTAAIKNSSSTDQLHTDEYVIELRAAESSLRATGLRSTAESELAHIAETAQWCVFARQQLLTRAMSLEELRQLVQEAKQIGIDETVGLCARLVDADRDVNEWIAEAQGTIGAKQMLDLHNVAKLLEKGRGLEVVPDSYTELRGMQQKALDLQLRIDRMIGRMESSDLVQRPRQTEAMLLSKECGDFGHFEPSQLDSLNAAIEKASRWSKDVGQLFTAVASLSDQPPEKALELVQNRLQETLKIIENSKPKDSSDEEEASPPETGALYCICLRPEYGLMVECENCSEWYHAQCMHLDENDIKDKPYACPICKAESKGERPQPPTEFPSESRIQRAVDDGRALNLVSNELDPLVTILLDSRALSSAIREVRENKQLIYTSTDSAGRKRKSMNLLLPAETKQLRVKLLRTVIRALLGLGVGLKRVLLDDLWLELHESEEVLPSAAAPDIPTPTSANSVDAVASFDASKKTSDDSTPRAQTLPVPSPGNASTDQEAQHDEFSLVIDSPSPQDEPQDELQDESQTLEIDESDQRRLEELVYLIINPPPAGQDRGQGLEIAGNMFAPDQENCVCNTPGADLALPEVAGQPVVQCDTCHENFHISCMQVPPTMARIIELNQIKRLLNADIDADVPDTPSAYMCPNCCIEANSVYPYGEIVID